MRLVKVRLRISLSFRPTFCFLLLTIISSVLAFAEQPRTTMSRSSGWRSTERYDSEKALRLMSEKSDKRSVPSS